jgi:hypothetical protein
MVMSPVEVAGNDLQVVWNPGQPLRANIIPELQVYHPRIEKAVEELPGFLAPVSIGLPHQVGVLRQEGHQFQHGRQMDGGLTSENLNGAGPSIECPSRVTGHGWGVERVSHQRVPALAAGDAEGTTQITAAQAQGEARAEFGFLTDLNLSSEPASPGPGPAKAFLPSEPVRAAAMGTQAAMFEVIPSGPGTFVSQSAT